MALKYQSGEVIQPGDRVTYGGNAGTIELVVESRDPEQDWLLKTSGAGVMVRSLRCLGAFTSTILMTRRIFCSSRERRSRPVATRCSGARILRGK
jgi:hypothetical protein